MDVAAAYGLLRLPEGTDLDRVRAALNDQSMSIDNTYPGAENAARRAQARAELNAAWSAINAAATGAHALPVLQADDQPAAYQAGYVPTPHQTGLYQTVPYQADAHQTGPSQAGAYQAAPYQAAPYQAAPYQAGPYQAGTYQAAPYQAAPNQAGPYEAGAYPAGPFQAAPPYCQHCGNMPAAPLKLSVTRGYVIFLRWQPQSRTLCRLCAEADYNDAQATSLMYGWWSLLFAPVINVVNMIRNRRAIKAHRKLVPLPQASYAYAQRESPYPRTSKPALRRRSPWVHTLAFVVLATFLLYGRIHVGVVENQRAVAGSLIECLDSSSDPVDCSAPSATREMRGPFYTEPVCRVSENSVYYPNSQHYWCEHRIR